MPVYNKMDQPIVCNSFIRLLLFMLTCVCVYCGPTKQNHQEIDSKLLKRIRLHQERLRRDLYGLNEVTKCSDSRQCFGNKTTFYTHPYRCYCDEACYKIFSDCCPDYEKQCGRQKLPKHKTSLWKCVEFDFNSWGGDYINGTTGVWMISKCPANWPSDKLKTKCENVPSKFSYPLEDYIPVVAAKGETYRNKHCALCNGVQTYTAWDFKVSTYIIPPEKFDLDSKLKFIEDNGGTVVIEPKRKQPWRFCFGRNFIDNCSLPDDKACVEGPVEVVVYEGIARLYFKNSACATCNGFLDINYFSIGRSGTNRPLRLPLPFSIVFDLEKKASGISTINTYCPPPPPHTIYDSILKFCRKRWHLFSPSYKLTNDKLTNEFLIFLWFKQFGGRTFDYSNPEKHNLRSALITQFCLRHDQISEMTFHRQHEENSLFVAEFHVTLTPFQSLLMANRQNGNFNLTYENTAFLELLNFTKAFTVSWQGNSFSVRKVLSKRLSCYDEINLQPNEYRIDGNRSFVVNKTGRILSLENYTLVEKEGGNITFCRKLVLSDCNEGAYVLLSPTEYVVFPNLTVYHNATKSVFNFGEYILSENKGTNFISNISKNSLVLSNSTISVCLPLKDRFNRAKIIYIRNTTSYALQILTLIGLSISIICLILLLVTFGLFQELRTVPGMNLMNLSFSMLLSQLLWLIGSSYFTGTTACKVFAILEHYLFQVSFLAMSVISYHSCYVFSQPFAGRVANKSSRRFIKYSAFVWLAPAIYVAICVTLDKTGAFLVDYGINCWLGNVDAKLYLFLLPLALLLVYNIFTFIRTAISLYRHDQNTQVLQRKKGKQNLIIYTKLATLVGFPWLFALIGIMFPDVEAFEYLFVVFACLQGLYIGMAFLFNKKTLNLYKDRWKIGSRRDAPS